MTIRLASITLAALATAACQPKPAPAPTPQPVAAQPAPPVKMVTMICRNSQTGASVACGTSNAVPVGVKSD